VSYASFGGCLVSGSAVFYMRNEMDAIDKEKKAQQNANFFMNKPQSRKTTAEK
jgi:hypothetical protein